MHDGSQRVKKLQYKLTKFKHHLLNLQAYKESNITPKGLIMKPKSTIFHNFSTPNFNTIWKKAHDELSMKLLQLSLDECKSQINLLTEKLINLRQTLLVEVGCNNLNEFDARIKTNLDKLEQNLENKRKNKLSRAKMIANHKLEEMKTTPQLKKVNIESRSKKKNKNQTEKVTPKPKKLLQNSFSNHLITSETDTSLNTDCKTKKKTEDSGKEPKTDKKPKTNVYNLSNTPLTKSQIDLLSRGLGFSVTPARADRFQLEADTNEFVRRLRLQEYFYGQEENNNNSTALSEHPPNLKPKRNRFWTPDSGRNTCLDSYVNVIKETINSNFKQKKLYSNITEPKQEALQRLKEKAGKELVYLPADKGGGVCVLRAMIILQKLTDNLMTQKYTRKHRMT